MRAESQAIPREPQAVSVVIATLGGDTLAGTIDQLNRGTIVPVEILICIPQQYVSRVDGLSYPNVKVIGTECRGQVAQRAVGFRLARSAFVLQMDDDIYLDESCLENLLDCIGGRANVSVSPTLLDCQTGRPSRFMRRPGRNDGFLEKLKFRIANGAVGYQPGRISKAGVNMAFLEDATEPYEVDWLPGGCVLHATDNLVLSNFYPFPGKAFSEDLYHSFFLREKGVHLYHCPNAVCRVDLGSSKAGSFSNLVRIVFGFARANLRFAKITGKSRLRYLAFLPLHLLLLTTHKLTGRR